MAAFKTLNSQDIIIAPLEVTKGFSFEGESELTASNVEIDRFLGVKSGTTTSTGHITNFSQSSIYYSAHNNFIIPIIFLVVMEMFKL